MLSTGGCLPRNAFHLCSLVSHMTAVSVICRCMGPHDSLPQAGTSISFCRCKRDSFEPLTSQHGARACSAWQACAQNDILRDAHELHGADHI